MGKLRQTQVTWNTKRGDLEVKLAKAKKAHDEDEIKALDEQLIDCRKQCKIADKRLELCVETRKEISELTVKIQDELDELLGQKKILSPTTTNSTAVSNETEGEQEPQRRTSKKL